MPLSSMICGGHTASSSSCQGYQYHRRLPRFESFWTCSSLEFYGTKNRRKFTYGNSRLVWCKNEADGEELKCFNFQFSFHI